MSRKNPRFNSNNERRFKNRTNKITKEAAKQQKHIGPGRATTQPFNGLYVSESLSTPKKRGKK